MSIYWLAGLLDRGPTIRFVQPSPGQINFTISLLAHITYYEELQPEMATF